MRVYDRIEDIRTAPPGSVAALGNFDGVHRGHRAVLDATRTVAAARGGQAIVITFRNHPREILSPGVAAPDRLQTIEDRLAEISRLGIDACAAIAFDQTLARTSACDFLASIVRDRMGASMLILGPDASFGYQGEATAENAAQIGSNVGVDVCMIPPLVDGGRPVSSSEIRAHLREGHAAAAARLLGRPYVLPGRVVAGEGRGRTLGFPTANLQPAVHLVIPGRGVYATRAERDGIFHASVTNVGIRPTFKGTAERVEVHLLDFSGELLGAPLRLHFLERLRDEQRFPSVELLRAQIARDAERAKSVCEAFKTVKS